MARVFQVPAEYIGEVMGDVTRTADKCLRDQWFRTQAEMPKARLVPDFMLEHDVTPAEEVVVVVMKATEIVRVIELLRRLTEAPPVVQRADETDEQFRVRSLFNDEKFRVRGIGDQPA